MNTIILRAGCDQHCSSPLQCVGYLSQEVQFDAHPPAIASIGLVVQILLIHENPFEIDGDPIMGTPRAVGYWGACLEHCGKYLSTASPQPVLFCE